MPDTAPLPAPISRRFSVLIALFILPAMGVSVYLLIASLNHTGVAGCGPGSGCDSVLASPYSKWLGIPTAGLALLVYADVLAGLVLLHVAAARTLQTFIHFWLAGLALLILGCAGWFTYLQAAVVGAFCPWCMTTHVLGSVGALLLLIPLSRRPLAVSAGLLLAVACLGALIAGQTLRPAPTHQLVAFHDLAIDVGKYPTLGRPEAPRTLVLLYDYTCPNCRLLHRYLETALEKYPGQFKVALGPAPLDNKCNPNYTETEPQHVGGCAYAQLALTIWRWRPERLAEYERFLYTGDAPPDVGVARAKAMELLAPRKLEDALADGFAIDFIRQQIALNERVRAKARAAGYAVGSGGVPTLILPNQKLVIGRPASEAEFLKLLAESLQPPAATSPAPKPGP